MITTLDLPARETPRPAPRQAPRGQFRGAVVNRITADWIAAIMSADQETRGSLRRLRARSRDLVRDDAHAAGLMVALNDNILGPKGIGVSPRMRSPREKKLLQRENLLAWEVFQRWGRASECSADGQLSWVDLQRLVARTVWVDGEAFVRRLSGFDNATGYALQMIDADLLDESFNLPAANGRNQVTQGIELNRWGRRVAFHFWTRHPSDGLSGIPLERVRVPADEVIHLFVRHRPNQQRGLPLLTPVLIAGRMVAGYTEAEVTAARIGATQGGFFIATGEDAAVAQSSYAGTAADGDGAVIEFDAEPGVDRQLPPGWQWQERTAEHPNGNFPEFLSAMLHVIARGVGVSYITLSGDLDKTSFSSGRIGLTAERDRFRAEQGWFAESFVLPVYRDVIRHSALAGLLTLPRGENIDYGAADAEPRGWDWIDPKSDAIATEMQLRGRLTSPQRVCAARGIDIEDVLDEWSEFTEMCAKRGLDVPTFGSTDATEPENEDEGVEASQAAEPRGARRLSLAVGGRE